MPADLKAPQINGSMPVNFSAANAPNTSGH
jgi:hypothetical protein